MRPAPDTEVFRYRRYSPGQVVGLLLAFAVLCFALTLLPGRGGTPLIDWLGIGGALAFFVLPMLLIATGAAAYSHRYEIRLQPQGIVRGRRRIPWRAVTGIVDEYMPGRGGGWHYVAIHHWDGDRRRTLRVTKPLADAQGRPFEERVRARWDAARGVVRAPAPETQWRPAPEAKPFVRADR